MYQCYIPKLPGKQQQFEMLSNTLKLSAMDEGHEQPDSVREKLIKYTAKYKVADWVEIHVGKR